jgi:hypothetical protein
MPINMPWMLLFHPGLLICLVVVSAVWPLGFVPAAVFAAVLVLGYAYLVVVPLRLSRFTRQRRRLSTTVGLLGSMVVTLAVFLTLMDLWGASWVLRWPVAFIASYYAGALVTTLLWLGAPRGDATRP